jgi:hypothetical protein
MRNSSLESKHETYTRKQIQPGSQPAIGRLEFITGSRQTGIGILRGRSNSWKDQKYESETKRKEKYRSEKKKRQRNDAERKI